MSLKEILQVAAVVAGVVFAGMGLEWVMREESNERMQAIMNFVERLVVIECHLGLRENC